MMAIEDTDKVLSEFPTEYKPLYISTKLIRLNPHNPRTEKDKESDAELQKSIAVLGVQTPIHIRPIDEDEEGHLYEVYDGDRRLRAGVKAKIAKVPVLILSKTDDEVLEFGITSTIRRGLSDVELGRALLELQKRFSSKYGKQRDMASKLGISNARINQVIKLVVNLDNEVQDMIAPADQSKKIPEGALDAKTGYKISFIPDKGRQREVAHEIISTPKLRGDRAKLLIKEAREEPETPVSELASRRLQEMKEKKTHVSMAMTPEDYERIRTGKQKILVEAHKRPGLSENVLVEALLKTSEPLEISDYFPRPLGRFNESDAKSAGFKDLATFKEAWIKRLGTTGDPHELVYVILFKKSTKSD